MAQNLPRLKIGGLLVFSTVLTWQRFERNQHVLVSRTKIQFLLPIPG